MLIGISVVLLVLAYLKGMRRGAQLGKDQIFKALHREDPHYSLGKLNHAIGEWQDGELRKNPKWYRKLLITFLKKI